MSDQVEPIRVHITGDDTKGLAQQKTTVTTLYTVVLTAANTYQLVLPHKPRRVCAYVQAGGANVVLCGSSSDAQKNTADPTYASPHGALLAFGNTSPTPIQGENEVWGGAAVYPAMVSVIDITEAD